MKEYDRFEKGAANSNKSTTILKRQLEDAKCKIIITTIQKLAIFCKKNQGHEVFSKRVCMIFDECHRSQFGKFHSDIIKSFKKYNLFGFTGTPIFAENMGAVIDPRYATTKHSYETEVYFLILSKQGYKFFRLFIQTITIAALAIFFILNFVKSNLKASPNHHSDVVVPSQTFSKILKTMLLKHSYPL